MGILDRCLAEHAPLTDRFLDSTLTDVVIPPGVRCFAELRFRRDLQVMAPGMNEDTPAATSEFVTVKLRAITLMVTFWSSLPGFRVLGRRAGDGATAIKLTRLFRSTPMVPVGNCLPASA